LKILNSSWSSAASAKNISEGNGLEHEKLAE